MYKADPNDKTKQIPKGVARVGDRNQSIAEVHPPRVIVKSPDHIIINKVNQNYKFYYHTSSSYGKTIITSNKDWITGSLATGQAAGGPQRLDINPVAWDLTDGAGSVGDITFVYRGKN